METTACTQLFRRFESLYDAAQEHPVDVDFTLPDYLPDIQKILKCGLRAQISNYSFSQDALLVDGVTDITVLYLDAKEEFVRSAQIRQPFSVQIKLRGNAEGASTTLSAHVEYSNCRAISARRMEVHGAISVAAKVEKAVAAELLSPKTEGSSLQVKSQELAVSAAAAQGNSQFTLEDTLELGNGKPPIETVISAESHCTLQECRRAFGKLELRAVLSVKVLYLSALDGTTCETMEFTLPLTRTEENTQLTDSNLVYVQLSAGELSVSPHADRDGENTALDLRARIFLSYTAYEETSLSVVTDAYSTAQALSLHTVQEPFVHILCTGEEAYTEKLTIHLEEDIEKVLDICCEMPTVTPLFENDTLVYKGKLCVGILGMNAKKHPFYTENRAEYSEQSTLCRQKPVGHVQASARAEISSVSYRITGERTVEVSLGLQLTTLVREQNNIRFVQSLEASEEAFQRKKAVVAYFATVGEEVWEIAKAFHAPLSAVAEENGCTEPVLTQNTTLFITA